MVQALIMPRFAGARSLRQLQPPKPSRQWSYVSHHDHGSRIDYVIHTPNVGISSPEYVNRILGPLLAHLALIVQGSLLKS